MSCGSMEFYKAVPQNLRFFYNRNTMSKITYSLESHPVNFQLNNLSSILGVVDLNASWCVFSWLRLVRFNIHKLLRISFRRCVEH